MPLASVGGASAHVYTSRTDAIWDPEHLTVLYSRGESASLEGAAIFARSVRDRVAQGQLGPIGGGGVAYPRGQGSRRTSSDTRALSEPGVLRLIAPVLGLAFISLTVTLIFPMK